MAGELDATKANAATLVAQLQLETADKQQLSTKLADSESVKNELEARVIHQLQCPFFIIYVLHCARRAAQEHNSWYRTSCLQAS